VAAKNRSQCTYDSMTATIGMLRKTDLPGAQQYALDLVKWVGGESDVITAGMSDIAAAHRGEGVSKAITAMITRARSAKADDVTAQWTTDAGVTAVAKKGAKPGASEAVNSRLLNQHTLAGMHSELLGMTRERFVKPRANIKNFKPLAPTEAIPTDGVREVIRRGLLGTNKLRSDGIPFVTSRAATKNSDEFHASHLTAYDIMDTLARVGGDDALRALQTSMFRHADPTQNISSQNLAEAVRRIVQHADEGRAFTDPDEYAELVARVRDGIENISGKPVNAKAKDLIAKNTQWVKSPSGQKAVESLTKALTEPAMITRLLEENTKQRMIMAALAKGDGFQMAEDVIKAIEDLPGSFEKAYGLGDMLMGKGLREIYRKDFIRQLSPDDMTMAYAEHGFAKLMAQLHPAAIAEAAETYANVTGVRAAAAASKKKGKEDKSPRNRKAVEKQDAMAGDVDKLTRDQLDNDHNYRAGGSSEEEAYFALKTYNEIQYGAIMGGAVKLIQKIYDPSRMTGRGKQILSSTENKFLENPVSMASSLTKLKRAFGNDSKRIDRVFNSLQDSPTGSAEEIAAAIAKLPEADQPLAEKMMYFIDHIFGNGQVNNMMSQGIFANEYAAALRASGLLEHGNFIASAGDIDPATLLNYWKQIALKDGQDAIETMNGFYKASQLAQLKPTIAASMIRNFGYQSYGLTRAEALAQGFKAVDDSTEFGKFLQLGDEPTLFPPEMFDSIRAMDEHLDFERGFGSLSKIMEKVDTTTSILKSSITIWRPGHHMVNLVGGVLMNALEGVAPRDYALGLKMLLKRGKIEGAEDRFMSRILAAEAPSGARLKDDALDVLEIPVYGADGKITMQKLDVDQLLYGSDGVAGVPIAERLSRDAIGQTDRATMLNGGTGIFKPVAAVDNQLARVSAARDNALRYAMFVKVLRANGPFKSLEDAYMIAGQKVHEYHPTVGTLTAWERKYARRAFYFYTWQKQALFKIMEYAANAKAGPAYLTIPSKLQFALAEAQGLNPESFGDPHDPHRIYAAYNSDSVYGPQWNDERWGAMGVRPAFPQADVIDAYLGQFRIKPEDGLWDNLGGLVAGGLGGIVGENMPPALRIPAELFTKNRIGGVGGEIDNIGEYFIDQTGLGTPSRIFDMTPWGPRSDTRLDAFSEENRARLGRNWFLGLKETFYQAPSSVRVGRQEEIDYWRKTLGQGRYAPKMNLWEYRQMLEGRGANE